MGDDGFERVELQLAAFSGHRDREVGSRDSERDLIDDLGDDGVDLARHDARTRLPGGQVYLAEPRLRANVSRLFADRCIDGVTADIERCRFYAEASPSIVTPLNAYIGYEEAAKVAKQALAESKTIRQVVLERGYVDAGKLTVEQLDSALDVLAMTVAPVG